MSLTKKLKFDEDVMDVLQEMRVEESPAGFLGFITSGQLERTLYERTNKALEALGGKWNRKYKAHVFERDPRAGLAGIVDSGETTVIRDGFFETPEKVTNRMLQLLPLPGYSALILEPSAGKGAILDVLLKQPGIEKHKFVAIEKNQQRREYLEGHYYPRAQICSGDFLEWKPKDFGSLFDRAYANPPFEECQDIDHVLHMYEFLRPGGWLISVMSPHFAFAEDRKSVEFREWLEKVKGVSHELAADSFKESGTEVNTFLVQIQRSNIPAREAPVQPEFDL